MISQIHFDRLIIINEEYEKLGIEKVSDLIETGKALVEKHGDENLNNSLQTEEEFMAAGTLFDFRIASDESLYDKKG